MKILLATDGSPPSREAEWFLCRVPFSEPVELTLATVTVIPYLGTMRREFPSGVQELIDEYQAQAQQLLDEEAVRFEGINGTVEKVILSGHPAEELIRYADTHQTDLIVLGARGRSATQRFLLGSVSQKVARHAPCSVLVLRPTGFGRETDRPLRILVCHDGSESSRRAVQAVSQISWGAGVEITVVRVLTVPGPAAAQVLERFRPLREREQHAAEDSLRWAAEQLGHATPHVHTELVEAEEAADKIIETIERLGADIVVMGARGLGRIERFFLGSTTEQVLRYAASSVWIVRTPRSSG